MINRIAIAECFHRRPLCSGVLIAQRGLAVEYCAMGALAKDCGVTDEELDAYPSNGYNLYLAIKDQLRQKFGIDNYNQFSSLMNVNDATSQLERTESVLDRVDDLIAQYTPSELVLCDK